MKTILSRAAQYIGNDVRLRPNQPRRWTVRHALRTQLVCWALVSFPSTTDAQVADVTTLLRRVDAVRVRVLIDGERYTRRVGLDEHELATWVIRWLTVEQVLVPADTIQYEPQAQIVGDSARYGRLDFRSPPTSEFNVGSRRPDSFLEIRLDVIEIGSQQYAFASDVSLAQPFLEKEAWVFGTTWRLRTIETAPEEDLGDEIARTIGE